MNQHLKKYAKPLICLAAGAVLLTGAVFANYDNANGYTSYKNAVKEMLNQPNFSADAEFSVDIDGEEMVSAECILRETENGYSAFYNSCEGPDYSGYESQTKEMLRDGWFASVDHIVYEDGREHTYWDLTRREKMHGQFQFDEDERPTVDRLVNFLDILADTVVGNLKNNFVMTDNQDGCKSYQISLTGSQMPELVRAGISLLVGTQKYSTPSSYYEESSSSDAVLYRSLMAGEEDPYIKSATCFLTLDEEGRLIRNDLSGTLTGFDKDGNTHDLNLSCSVKLFDYGTTVPGGLDELMNEIPAIDAADEYGSELTLQDLISSGMAVTYNDDARSIYGHIQPVDYSADGMTYADVGRLYINNGSVVSEEAFNQRYEDTKAEESEVVPEAAAAVGIIGGDDGPTAVYVTTEEKTSEADAVEEGLSEEDAIEEGPSGKDSSGEASSAGDAA